MASVMWNSLRAYWQFLNRPASSSSITRGIEALPNLLRDTIVITIIFSIIFLLVNPFISKAFPAVFKSLPGRKKTELPSYVLCLVHHIVAVPFAWITIYRDFNLTAEAMATIDYAPITGVIAPWCISYLVADTVFFAIPEAFTGKFEYIIHHVLTLSLVVSSLFAPGPIMRFIPHLLISDTTNLLFNTAWLVRLFGEKKSFILQFLEVSFLLSFFLLRAVNMPCMFWALGAQADGLGYAKYVLVPIALMQWYWFHKILRITVAKIFDKAPVSNEKSGVEETKKRT